jgi:hypothetical protein
LSMGKPMGALRGRSEIPGSTPEILKLFRSSISEPSSNVGWMSVGF